jgi:hypothetical protein
VAFNLDEIYEYSYVTMYARTETTTINGGYYHRKYETFFKGEYDENTISFPVGGDTGLSIVLGCKIYADFINGPTDVTPYGLCMRGWI